MASSGLIEVFTPGTTTLKDRKEREVIYIDHFTIIDVIFINRCILMDTTTINYRMPCVTPPLHISLLTSPLSDYLIISFSDSLIL